MKHLAIIALAAMCVLFACTKDSVQTDQVLENLPVGDRGNSVNICHKTGNGRYNSIWVNQNAVPAHLAHGDYLPDADGDGYSAIGACTGSMDDCDDNNADVHPGADEVCGNGIDDNCDGNTDEGCDGECPPFSYISYIFTEEVLNYYAPYGAYYDSDVLNCSGLIDGAALFNELFVVYAIEVPDEDEGTVKLLAIFADGIECIYAVGDNLTEEEYEFALAGIRAAIAANPDTPNFCGSLRAATKRGPYQLFDDEALRAKMKPMSPAKLLEQFNNR